ncbi:MAG: thioredoxin domain-containing protein [Dehalococcoidia bacterium]|nr:thioredoxin domain-containing protein [Dehalococcoidia bacterium]
METNRTEETPPEGHNRLVFEKSPYLLQHARNPVDWYPWGPEAFQKARYENKPIFLSIGYSTCHWCHVMAHESFEDPEVARLLNQAFVCVKVDREERPDIDSVYMTAAQLFTGRGGWPLTIIMTPEGKPFFAATYIPREARWGGLGMMELIPRFKRVWDNQKNDVLRSAETMVNALKKVSITSSGGDLGQSLSNRAYGELSKNFDAQYGGFGGAPKFPTPHHLTFLLRYWKKSGDAKALHMAEATLQAMRLGGIYDHIGFGFHRYSTDQHWLVPHFEKMLYDQALLAMAYTEAYQATGKEEYQITARQIFTYVLRDMTSPEGGFYSAEDADSEGVEGKFYLWRQQEIEEVLAAEEADLIQRLFDIDVKGNFIEEITGKPNGSNIFHMQKPLAECATPLSLKEEDLGRRFEQARVKLFLHREKRVHPHKDDKVLTDWNGLMIAALSKAAQAFAEPLYAEAARRAADFLLQRMRVSDGSLLHRYREGEAALPAYAEDYAFLIWGLIDLYEATFEVRYLKTALDLNTHFLEHFWDRKDGGFYATSDKAEALLIRTKEIYDGAIPSANSVAMLNLLRLGRMTADPELEARAAEIGRAFSLKVENAPSGHTQLMCALDFSFGDACEVVIAGDSQASDTRTMLEALRRRFIPNKVVLFIPAEEPLPQIHQLARFTKHQTSLDGKATAYVCKNFSCQQPTTDISRMLELVEKRE